MRNSADIGNGSEKQPDDKEIKTLREAVVRMPGTAELIAWAIERNVQAVTLDDVAAKALAKKGFSV